MQINCLENTMLDNSTAIRRPKGSVNGTERSVGGKTPAMEHNSSQSHDVRNVDPEHLTLWQHPITTLHYFFSEVAINVLSLAKKTLLYKRTVCAVISIVILFLLSGRISGPQQEVIHLQVIIHTHTHVCVCVCVCIGQICSNKLYLLCFRFLNCGRPK